VTAIAFHHREPGSGGLIRVVRELARALVEARRASAARRAHAALAPNIRADIGLPPRLTDRFDGPRGPGARSD
jgi:hypothetical protein